MDSPSETHDLTVGSWTAFRTFWVVLLGFALLALLVLLLFRSGGPYESFESRRARARADKLRALHREERTKLGFYGWADKAAGTVRIPITRAMELQLAVLQAKPVSASAIPVEDPYPFGLRKTPVAEQQPTVPANSGAVTNPAAPAAEAASLPAPPGPANIAPSPTPPPEGVDGAEVKKDPVPPPAPAPGAATPVPNTQPPPPVPETPAAPASPAVPTPPAATETPRTVPVPPSSPDPAAAAGPEPPQPLEPDPAASATPSSADGGANQ